LDKDWHDEEIGHPIEYVECKEEERENISSSSVKT